MKILFLGGEFDRTRLELGDLLPDHVHRASMEGSEVEELMPMQMAKLPITTYKLYPIGIGSNDRIPVYVLEGTPGNVLSYLLGTYLREGDREL